MKDPFYAQLMLQIEHIICQADKEAKTKGIELNDSQVRSAIIRTMKIVQGKSPEIPKSNDREQILADLVDSLIQARNCLAVEEEATSSSGEAISPIDWCRALDTVQDSIKTRKGDFPGSRLYMDYIRGFIARARQR